MVLWFASRLENLIHVLLTIFVRGLKVMQLLIEIGDVGLQLRRLRGQSVLDCRAWTENKPGCLASATLSEYYRRNRKTHIFPTPSYTLVSLDSCLTSLEVSSSIRMSRCFAETAALTVLISRWADKACNSISWASCGFSVHVNHWGGGLL